MRQLFWLFGLIAALLVWQWLDQRDAVRELRTDGSFDYPGYTIAPLEQFELTGRVLSTHSYRSGREAELSPIDLAMGWDQMAEPGNIAQLNISQRNRWMYWKAQTLPLPRRKLESSMANIHIIPASATIAEQVNLLDAGAMVTLIGQLVQVDGDDGWRWRSSLSRTDTGDKSCEVLWLEQIQAL
ncbi:MAG: hypothetical protein AB8B93_13720 [Pseudomonadales bacterium]